MLKIYKALINMGGSLDEWKDVVIAAEHEQALKKKDDILNLDAVMMNDMRAEITALKRDNEVMAALNDSFPAEIVKLEEQVAKLKAYKQNNYDPAESIRLNAEIVALKAESKAKVFAIAELEDANAGLVEQIERLREELGKYESVYFPVYDKDALKQEEEKG